MRAIGVGRDKAVSKTLETLIYSANKTAENAAGCDLSYPAALSFALGRHISGIYAVTAIYKAVIGDELRRLSV